METCPEKLSSMELCQHMSTSLILRIKVIQNWLRKLSMPFSESLQQNHAEWSHRDLPNRSGSPFPGNQPKGKLNARNKNIHRRSISHSFQEFNFGQQKQYGICTSCGACGDHCFPRWRYGAAVSARLTTLFVILDLLVCGFCMDYEVGGAALP